MYLSISEIWSLTKRPFQPVCNIYSVRLGALSVFIGCADAFQSRVVSFSSDNVLKFHFSVVALFNHLPTTFYFCGQSVFSNSIYSK